MKYIFSLLLIFLLRFSYSQIEDHKFDTLNIENEIYKLSFINYYKYRIPDTIYSNLTKVPMTVIYLVNILFESNEIEITNIKTNVFQLFIYDEKELSYIYSPPFEYGQNCYFPWIIPKFENIFFDFFYNSKVVIINDPANYIKGKKAIIYQKKFTILPEY